MSYPKQKYSSNEKVQVFKSNDNLHSEQVKKKKKMYACVYMAIHE